MTDIDWALIARYAAGECSPEERVHVEHLLAEPSRYPEALAAIDWVASHSGASVMPTRRMELHDELRAKIVRERRISRVAFPLKVAAAVLLAVGVSVAGYVAWHRPVGSIAAGAADQGGRVVVTTRGQRLSLRLSDGTIVVLGPASTLHVPSNYGTRNRMLDLVGQAAFTVTHDARRPFAVRAGDILATDLGTEFVVRAYPEHPHAEVVVREGLVGIRALAAEDTAVVTVHPGQQGLLAASGVPMVRPADTAAAFAWTVGRLVFRDTPLAEAAAQLERLYDIEIQFASPDLAMKAVSGTVIETRPVSQALDMIAAVLRLDAVETGPRNYTLRAR